MTHLKGIPAIVLLTATLMFSCDGEPSETYDANGSLIAEGESPEVIVDGFQFTEGPYWHDDGFLIFSDIPANTVYKWTPGSSEAEVFIEPSGNSNGISANSQGDIILAQHAGRVSRLTDDGELIPLIEQYDGKRLNSPNDLAIREDDIIYFTDPDFGVSEEDKELDFSGVYRLTPDGELTVMYDGFALPNGILFSPDETKLYVNDSATGDIIVFDVDDNGDLSEPRPFGNIGEMSPQGWGADGMATDTDGRIYTAGPNGLTIFDADGNELENLSFDIQITNLDWGGDDLNWLFITATDRVYRLVFDVTGVTK